MIDINNIIDRYNMELTGAIKSLPCMSADMLGLDKRAGQRLYIDEDNRCIYVESHNLRALDYYGGFEYVKDDDGRLELGSFVRFDGYDNERVADCFEYLNDNEEDNDE
jgi:hypothetical protein